MVFMAQRVLFLSSVLLFTACNEQIELQSFNASSLHLENRNGIVYHEKNPFTGSVFELNEKNDTIALFGFYKGKEHGEWKHFYDNGQIQEIRYFDKGVKIKTLKRWWENGQLQFQCTFKNGEYEGTLQEWNENGQLTKEMNYQNGYENGSQKMYYDNGKIRSNYVVKNGKRTGLLGTKNCVNVSDSIFKK
jgi:antitoxin component YwqK of YwqJK toxin-antitoxin module